MQINIDNANGAIQSYEESIRGQIIYLVQSTFPNSDNLMELLLMIDAAKQRAAGILFSNPSDALERMFTEYRL